MIRVLITAEPRPAVVPISRSIPALSDREQEVLALVGEALPNKLVARRLGITERTVKAHLTSIYQQLGVTNRTQAALWVQRQAGIREAAG